MTLFQSVPYAKMEDADKVKYGYDKAKEDDYNRQIEQKRQALLAKQKAEKELTERHAKEQAEAADRERREEDERRAKQAEAQARRTREQDELQARVEEASRQDCIRIVQGKAYDFSDPILCARLLPRGQQDFPYKKYCIVGTVIQVTEDGLLVDSSGSDADLFGETVLVKDYGKAQTVTDGEIIKSWGLARGRYQYTSVIGSIKTVPVFYCATKPTAGEMPQKVLPLP